MKKQIFLALLGCFTLASVSNAAERTRTDFQKTPVTERLEISGEVTINGRTFKIGKPDILNKGIKTRDAAITDVITEAPGREQYYCKDVIGYGLGSPIQGYAVASNINWDGDDAYFLNIITAAPMGTYVKATVTDAELVLPMNQTVLTYDDEDYAINLGLMRPIFTLTSDSDGEESLYIWFEYSDDYDTVSYSIDSNGTLMLEDHEPKYSLEEYDPADYNFPYYVIGYYYTDDYSWTGYCDALQAYDEFNFEKVEVPEGLEFNTTLSYINAEGMGVIVYVGETEDALYLKGLSPYAPDAVVKGDLLDDGTRLAVAPDQFIGIEAYLYYIITSTAYIKDGYLDVVTNELPAYFEVERDNEGKILSITADDSDYFLTFNDDPFYFYPLDVFMDLALTAQDSFAGVPSTPQKAYYEDYSSMMGANFIFFELSSFAANGDIIDVNQLFYSIYMNGDPVEFEEQDGLNLLDEPMVMYRGIKEPTYLVPYTFANDVDLYEDMGGTFVVALYADGIETVGVQAVYTYGEEPTYSGLVTIDTLTGEETITPGTDTKVEYINITDVENVEYYNLNGMKIANPDKGLYLKKYKMTDGSIKTHKVIIR